MGKKILRYLKPNLDFLRFAGGVILLFTFFRIAFFFRYLLDGDKNEPFLILKAFALGLRYDLSITASLWGIFFLLDQIPKIWQGKRFYLFWNSISYALVPISILLCFADFFFYEHGGKRIGFEATAFLNKDLSSILGWFWEQNPISFSLSVGILIIVSLFLLIHFSKTVSFRFLKEKQELTTNTSFRELGKVTLIRVFIAILFVLVLVRGGFQSSPLRAGSAIISTNTHLNNLVLNPVFTALTDLKSTSLPASEKMEIFQALAIVKEVIQYPGAEFLSSSYPLLRRTIPEKNPSFKSLAKGEKPNVVLVLLESWSGKFISSQNPVRMNGKVVAPFFQKRLSKGVYFPRFFATGGRTTNGMLAMITGIPDKPGLTAVRTSGAMTKVSALGSLFNQSGYQTLFLTGGDLSFDNLSEILPQWGYKTILGEKELGSLGNYQRGGGGYDDETIYQELHENLLRTETEKSKPLFATVLTLTTHYPYKVPRKEFEIFSESIADADYLNAYHYADFAIESFLQKAQSSPYFNKTIFVFVGDHTHHRDLNYYEDRNIPFLIYSPKLIAPEIREDIASQLDVLPTLISFLPEPVEFSAMGKDILHNKSKSAYFAYGSGYGWIEDNVFLFRSVDGKLEFPLTVEPPLEKSPLCEKFKKVCEPYSIKAKSYLNLGTELINRNLIFPGESLK